jgi:hypothetical protein
MSLFQAIARVTRAAQDFIEQRRSAREQVSFPAWIELGQRTQRRDCTVLDVSDGGARVWVPAAATLPREFWLVFSKDGALRRHCRLVWRADEQIGLRYLGSIQSKSLPWTVN